MAADGTFTYTPNNKAFGDDSFTYKANDGKIDSNMGTVSIIIKPNFAPEAVDSSYFIKVNGNLNGKLNATDDK